VHGEQTVALVAELDRRDYADRVARPEERPLVPAGQIVLLKAD
jgi:hypothetical protein